MKEKIIDFFTFRKPIGRFLYLIYTLCCALLNLFGYLIFTSIELPNIGWAVIGLLFLLILPLLLYINTIMMMKRFWDIFAKKYIAVIVTVLYYLLITLVVIFSKEDNTVEGFIITIFGIVLLLVKGRITGKNEEVSLSTQVEGDSQEG